MIPNSYCPHGPKMMYSLLSGRPHNCTQTVLPFQWCNFFYQKQLLISQVLLVLGPVCVWELLVVFHFSGVNMPICQICWEPSHYWFAAYKRAVDVRKSYSCNGFDGHARLLHQGPFLALAAAKCSMATPSRQRSSLNARNIYAYRWLLTPWFVHREARLGALTV